MLAAVIMSAAAVTIDVVSKIDGGKNLEKVIEAETEQNYRDEERNNRDEEQASNFDFSDYE